MRTRHEMRTNEVYANPIPEKIQEIRIVISHMYLKIKYILNCAMSMTAMAPPPYGEVN